MYGDSITGNDDNVLVDYEILPTTEGGYAIALLKRITTLTEDPHSSPQWKLFVTFWQPGSPQFDTPRLIWQSPNPLFDASINGCGVTVDGKGYFCILRIPTVEGYDNVKVAFLSSGSVTNVM